MSSSTADKTAMLTLRIGIALTCVGTAARLLLYGGPVFSWLWFQHDWSETSALKVEYAAAFGLLACMPFVFWRKAWPVLELVAAWLLLSAIASMFVETWHPEVEPAAHAAGYLAPLALTAFSLKTSPGRRKLGEWLLRIGTGATFIAHGTESLLQRAQFVDYLIGSSLKLLRYDLPESTARSILLAIGVVDVLAGCAILVPKRWRPLALWLACWGLLTACARIVYLGWPNWPETLIRMTNCAAPLTLFWFWSRREDAKTQ